MLEPMIPPPTMVILLMVRLLGSIQQPSDGKPSSLADCRGAADPWSALCQSHSKPEAARSMICSGVKTALCSRPAAIALDARPCQSGMDECRSNAADCRHGRAQGKAGQAWLFGFWFWDEVTSTAFAH